MNKGVEIVVGATAGALASELLVVVIKELKAVLGFNSAFKELASTMEEVFPIVTQIESLQDDKELKTLKDTIVTALELIQECADAPRLKVCVKQSYYTRKIERINRKMLKFCQVQVPLILLRNQNLSKATREANEKCIQIISERLHLMTVSNRNLSAFRNYCSVPKPRKVPVGFGLPLMKLKEKLLTDSVDTLLVSAPGGCGKTMLVTHLCHDEEIKGHFNHIFFNLVSSTPDFTVIVKNLFQHNGYQPVSFENSSQAAVALTNLLEELIEDGPILLVLDDVWQGADALLTEFGIKLPGYKILVTSRFNFPSFDFTYSLETLKYEDAKSLLIQCASPPYHTSPDEYERLIQKVLEHCNGFPILIEVVGGSLNGQPLYSWKGLVEIWSEGNTILRDPGPNVLECLERSFIPLKPHLKECFMDLGSFPKGQKISASVLLDIWVELYGKGSSNVYMKYLNDLASQNLLKLITNGGNEHEDGFFNDLFITQHDLLRELAIHQSESEAILERKRRTLVIRGNNYPDWCLNLRKPSSINTRFLSISTDDLFSSSWVEMDLFHFPNVEALLLNISSSSYALPSFIAKMKTLKVVIIINHDPDSAKLTKLLCLSSLENLKRIRLEKVSVTLRDILRLRRLVSLKKLSLVMCSLSEVFYGSEEIDVSKAFPSLQEIEIDYGYDLDEFSYLISGAVSGELKQLKLTIQRARVLVIKFPDVQKSERTSKIEEDINKDLSKFCDIDLQLLQNWNQLPLARSLMHKLLSVSEALELVIEEAKKYKSFTLLSKDLVSTMERLLTLTKKIDSMQNKLDLGTGELKQLRDTIERARVLVLEFPDASLYKESNYTKKIVKINEDLAKFCDYCLQLLQYMNKLTLLSVAENLVDKVDGLSKRMDGFMHVPVPDFRNLCSVPKLNKVLVGLDWPLMTLKKRLLDDAVDDLVVSAPPGCGKTTLAVQLCHDADVKGHFKHILFNVVSSTPKFRVIVQNLLQHNGYPHHRFENDSQATAVLIKLLKTLREDGSILLVLDDVWPGAESLLQKFRITLPDYKILVTSRADFPSFGFNYHLKPLEDKDAKALLIRRASRPDNTSQAEYDDLLQKILKRCSGFPILIEVVGVSLRGRSLTTWKYQVESWSQGETILDSPSRPTVLECLQPSFDALVPNLKECFLDMGSFLEDQKICASVIIDIWMELYDKSSSILCMKYLEDLASQNLLKIVPLGNETEDGFYNEFLVTQHDILRELAIRQSELEAILERKRLNLEIREDTFPDWCLSGPVVNASRLSISTDDMFSSNWVEMDCPSVEALVLNLSSLDYALPSFIAGMRKLKVLTITNHGFYPAKLRNFSCLSLLPNLKRIRLEKVSVTLLDIVQLKLRSLKKLSLVMCSFGDVFYDSEDIDVSKALPSLQEIDIDYCYDLGELPYWVCEVGSLKTLSITNCYKLSVLPEDLGNLSKLEVLRVNSCINLSELPETTDRLSNLRFLDISHCLGLRKLPLEIGKSQKLKKISMRKCWRCELPVSVRDLEDLEVKCDEETGFVLWERLKPIMRNLRVHEEETEHNLNLLQMF